jgi:hypothetical protein
MSSGSPLTLKARTQGRVESQLPLSENSYEYEALLPRHIRVLKLFPGADSAIAISLESVPLDDNEEAFEGIEALSYTWGKRSPAQIVHCNSRTISVTPNLYDALNALRESDDFRVLWIDQICINQQDNEEKSAQVQLMHLIYSKACHVLVWLSNEVFLWKGILDHLKTLHAFTISNIDSGRDGSAISQPFNSIPTLTWLALVLVFLNPYFTRVWMIQEVVMAKKCLIVAGGSYLDWQLIEHLAMLFHQEETGQLASRLPLPAEIKHNTRCFRKMLTLRQRLQSKLAFEKMVWSTRPRWSLLDMVRKSWMFNATDKRDKVYALVGLLEFTEHCIPQEIYPDYSPTTTYESLVRKVVIHGLTKESKLEPLLSCRPRQQYTLPSWAFDTEDIFATSMAYQLGFESEKYLACGKSAPEVRLLSEDESAVLFKVTHIGKISELAQPFPNARTSQEKFDVYEKEFSLGFSIHLKDMQTLLRNNVELIHGIYEKPYAGLCLKDRVDICRAFFCDISFDEQRFLPTSIEDWNGQSQEWRFRNSDKSASRMRREIAEVDSFIRLFIQEYEDEGDRVFQALLHRFPKFSNALKRISDMRFGSVVQYNKSEKNDDLNARPGLSLKQSSTMCWVPLEAEIDDVITVIHGFRMPMLLRRVPGSEERYRFLGICFVYRFMDGEALETEGLYAEDILVL